MRSAHVRFACQELWRDLYQNPGDWYDNRADVAGTKLPDYKHKTSGKALWLGCVGSVPHCATAGHLVTRFPLCPPQRQEPRLGDAGVRHPRCLPAAGRQRVKEHAACARE